jgi:oligopeptidase B
MRDEKRENKDILDHLEAENAYTEGLTSHLEGLRQTLYDEMLAAIQETDYTTPRPHGDWYYYTRTFEGKSYTTHVRAPRQPDTPLSIQWDRKAESPILPGEQITLDVNVLAEGKKYCSTGSVTKSPSQKYLAYSADFTGGETCVMYVKDLTSGDIVDHDETLEMSGSIRWGADDNELFYLKMDEAHRPYQVYRRRLGNNDPDEMLLEEKDELYWMGISKSLDGKYLFIEVSSKETSEIHFLDLTDPNANLQCVAPRRLKVLYDVEHRNGRWWIESNVGGLPDMALWAAPANAHCADEWQLVTDAAGVALFEGGEDRALSAITCFQDFVVMQGREGGLPRVWIAAMDGDSVQTFQQLLFDEDAYDAGVGTHYEYDTRKIAVAYDSLVTPTQSLEIDLANTNERTVLKERAVPGYDKELYACERTTVKSRDGSVDIPVSLVYRKDVMEDHLQSGKAVHTHLYGYGSYGACIEADFRSTRLPLLNRGVIYVIAHIRGGGEMGRKWYEEPNGAKYLCKKNTFDDFVDVAKWLISDRKLTSPDVLSCEGRSAGGLLIGSSINQAPELFQMAILGVPFVDVLCTMVDASIPLTAVEWEEWGNPNEEKYHQYMKEYCPVQNVKKARYPSCLLTGGLHDPRVQYWEPSKFAATLRHTQSNESGPVCVKMDMSAGHFSASDRYKYLKELAFDYAFLLDQVGLAKYEVDKPAKGSS